MNWLLNIFSWVLGRLFGKPPGPSHEAQEAQKAGEATVALGQAQAADKAAQAVAQAEASAPTTEGQVEDRLSKGTF